MKDSSFRLIRCGVIFFFSLLNPGDQGKTASLCLNVKHVKGPGVHVPSRRVCEVAQGEQAEHLGMGLMLCKD